MTTLRCRVAAMFEDGRDKLAMFYLLWSSDNEHVVRFNGCHLTFIFAGAHCLHIKEGGENRTFNCVLKVFEVIPNIQVFLGYLPTKLEVS